MSESTSMDLLCQKLKGHVTIVPEKFDMDGLDQVLDFLFISSLAGASNKELLLKHGITHIVNASGLQNSFKKDFVYFKVDVMDSPATNLKIYFEACNEFILSAKESNGKVLVHCHAGVSRSASLVLAYLIAYESKRVIPEVFKHNVDWILNEYPHYTVEDLEIKLNESTEYNIHPLLSLLDPKDATLLLFNSSLLFLSKARFIINPNSGFRTQLLNWTQSLCGNLKRNS